MKKQKSTGVNLKQFKNWIKDGIGNEPCGDYCGDCLNCRAWEIYHKLKDLLWFCDMLDEETINKKKIREHPKEN